MCPRALSRAGRVRRHAQHLEPVPRVQGPERQLRRAVRSLAELRLRHRLAVPFVGLVGDVILGERLVGARDGEMLPIEPDGRVATGQAGLTIEAPVTGPHVPRAIHDAPEPGGVADALSFLGRAGTAVDPGAHRRRAAGRRVAVPVRPVVLRVVAADPVVVDGEELRPGRRPAEIPAGHPALHGEGGLDVMRPGLPVGDLSLAAPQRVVDPPRLLRLGAAAVADQRFGGTRLTNGGREDEQIRGQLLGARQPAGADRARVVVQDGDAVDVAPAEPVQVEVAQVDRPDLVPPPRREGHRFRVARRALEPG